MSDVWDSFSRGYGIGSEMGATARNARAYRDGGMDAVVDQAGRTGDLPTVMQGRRFQDEQHQQAYQWFTQNAPYARNVLRAARNIQDPERRRQFLQGQRQRFEGMGFQPEQVDGAIDQLVNPDTADQAFTQYDSAFTQYQDPNWQLVQTPQGQQAASIDPNSGHIALGDNAVPRGGSDYLTAEELQQRGYAPNTVVMRMPDGSERVMQQPHYGRAGASSGPPTPPNGYRIIQP